MNPEEENERLRKENKGLREALEKACKEKEQLKKENKDMKKIFTTLKQISECRGKKDLVKTITKALNKLAFYESPNMPSSAPKLNTPNLNSESNKPKRKRGGQKGHKPANRKKPDKIDDAEVISLTHCPICSTKLGDWFSLRWRIAEDVVFENFVKSILYIILLYYCPKCKKSVSGIPLDILPKMNFGTNVTVLTPFLKYKYRLTFKLIRKFFKDFFGFTASEGAYAYQIKKIAKILRKPYKDIEDEIRNSESIGVDETGEKWLGGKAWGWQYLTKLASLYKLERTRSHEALHKTVGDNYDGGVNCDGHGACNFLKNAKKQRCWEHIWRPARCKIKEGEASRELEGFYKKLVHILKLADSYKKKNFPFKDADKVKNRYYRILGNHIEKLYKDPTVKKIIASIHKYWEKDELFTFLEYKDLNYHNNNTERELREEVIQRKISGGVKSDEGAECRSILRSVIKTYEKKGMDFMEEVKKLITASNLAE